MAISMQGDPIHGEVSSADASGGVAFTLYPAGSVTARTLASNEFVVITDIIFIATVGGAYALVAAADSAGRRIAKGIADAKGGLAHHFETPRTCPVGVTPKLIAAAGQVDCIITGYICQA